MRLSYLETLIDIVETKSVSKTAKRLFISQPAVSKQIKALEDYYGEALIRYVNREVILTEMGYLVYQFAINTVNSNKNLISNIMEVNQHVAGEVDILTSNIPAYYFLPNLIKGFTNFNGQILPNIIISDTDDILNKLDKGLASFAFVGKRTDKSNLVFKKVFEADMVLVGSKKYKNQIVSKEFYRNEKFITREEGSATRESLIKLLKTKYDIKFNNKNVLMKCADNELIKQVILSQKALAYLPKCSVEEEITSENLVIIEEGEKRSFYFVYNAKRILTPLENALFKYVLREGEKQHEI